MAAGDIIWFEEARSLAFMAGWASGDTIKCAIIDNTVAPAAGTVTPALGDFTEVGTAGSYVAGGATLGTWGALWSESAGTATFDSATNPTWAQNASNDTDARWGVLYNDTQAGDDAFAYVDLGAAVDMSAGSLTINWNAAGIATVTAA